MRPTILYTVSTALLVLGTSNVTSAHTLSTGETVVRQLHHQVFAMHHLPTTVLLTTLFIAGGLLLTRQRRKKLVRRYARQERLRKDDA